MTSQARWFLSASSSRRKQGSALSSEQPTLKQQFGDGPPGLVKAILWVATAFTTRLTQLQSNIVLDAESSLGAVCSVLLMPHL